MMKRVLASILSLVLMITSIGSTVFANSIGYPETVGNETSEWLTADELTLLRKLDIATYDTILEMEGNDERIMSRDYMAWYCARLVEMDTTKPAKYETLFDDLSIDNSFYPYIKGLYEAGFMNGYSNYLKAKVKDGMADVDIMANVFSVNATKTSNGVEFRMGDSVVKFTNNSNSYVINGETKTAETVVLKNGYLDIKTLCDIYGKVFRETERSYSILDKAPAIDHYQVQIDELA